MTLQLNHIDGLLNMAIREFKKGQNDKMLKLDSYKSAYLSSREFCRTVHLVFKSIETMWHLIREHLATNDTSSLSTGQH